MGGWFWRVGGLVLAVGPLPRGVDCALYQFKPPGGPVTHLPVYGWFWAGECVGGPPPPGPRVVSGRFWSGGKCLPPGSLSGFIYAPNPSLLGAKPRRGGGGAGRAAPRPDLTARTWPGTQPKLPEHYGATTSHMVKGLFRNYGHYLTAANETHRPQRPSPPGGDGTQFEVFYFHEFLNFANFISGLLLIYFCYFLYECLQILSGVSQ